MTRLPFAARRDPCELAMPEPPLADALAELVREVRELRADVRAVLAGRPQRKRPTLEGRDRGALAALVPAIHAAIGGTIFCAVDLAALATLPDRARLAAALAPVLRATGGLRPLGRLLARGAGHDFRGLRLRRVGDARDGACWLIETRETRTRDCAQGGAPAR
jgi:hypothetical protein